MTRMTSGCTLEFNLGFRKLAEPVLEETSLNLDNSNYEVVTPPVGATVPYLPDEAKEETIGGKKYFVHDKTYYRPFASDGETIYMIVEDPKTTKQKGT